MVPFYGLYLEAYNVEGPMGRLPFRLRFIRVPYYIGDLKQEP